METVIVCTDFSEASRNALSYSCKLAHDNTRGRNLDFILLHLYDVPATYSGDGLALTTINDEMVHAENLLEEELNWAKTEFPHLSIRKKMATGLLLPGLREQIEEENPLLIVIGAGGHYSDILSWDNELLEAIRELPVPVLVIPKGTSCRPLQRVGYSCKLQNVGDRTPFETVVTLVQFTGAQLHVIFVDTEAEDQFPEIIRNKNLVMEKLAPVHPVYHTLHSSNAVEAIGNCIKEENIELLLVTARKHGLWYTLFHKNHAKELVRLNSLPILTMREG